MLEYRTTQSPRDPPATQPIVPPDLPCACGPKCGCNEWVTDWWMPPPPQTPGLVVVKPINEAPSGASSTRTEGGDIGEVFA